MLNILADTFMIAARTDRWAARDANDGGSKPLKGWGRRRGDVPRLARPAGSGRWRLGSAGDF